MNEAKKSVFSIKLKWKILFLVHWVSGSLPQRLSHRLWVANIGGVFMQSSSPRRGSKHERGGSGAKSHVTAGFQRMNLRLGM